VFRPLHSYEVFNDGDINLKLIEAVLDMLENPNVVADELVFEFNPTKESLSVMRQQAFRKLAQIEQNQGMESLIYTS
jgi:hypothetical protein